MKDFWRLSFIVVKADLQRLWISISVLCLLIVAICIIDIWFVDLLYDIDSGKTASAFYGFASILALVIGFNCLAKLVGYEGLEDEDADWRTRPIREFHLLVGKGIVFTSLFWVLPFAMNGWVALLYEGWGGIGDVFKITFTMFFLFVPIVLFFSVYQKSSSRTALFLMLSGLGLVVMVLYRDQSFGGVWVNLDLFNPIFMGLAALGFWGAYLIYSLKRSKKKSVLWLLAWLFLSIFALVLTGGNKSDHGFYGDVLKGEDVVVSRVFQKSGLTSRVGTDVRFKRDVEGLFLTYDKSWVHLSSEEVDIGPSRRGGRGFDPHSKVLNQVALDWLASGSIPESNRKVDEAGFASFELPVLRYDGRSRTAGALDRWSETVSRYEGQSARLQAKVQFEAYRIRSISKIPLRAGSELNRNGQRTVVHLTENRESDVVVHSPEGREGKGVEISILTQEQRSNEADEAKSSEIVRKFLWLNLSELPIEPVFRRKSTTTRNLGFFGMSGIERRVEELRISEAMANSLGLFSENTGFLLAVDFELVDEFYIEIDEQIDELRTVR